MIREASVKMTSSRRKDAAAAGGESCGLDSNTQRELHSDSRGEICSKSEENHVDEETRSCIMGSRGEGHSIKSHMLIKNTTSISTNLLVCCYLALMVGISALIPVHAYSGDLDRHPQSSEPENQEHRLSSSRRSSLQATRAPNSFKQGDGNEQYEGDDAIASIDRFDLGEQIRAPLLKSPTTLAPLKSANEVARRSDQTYRNEEYENQDQNDAQSPTMPDLSGQMTADERDQLMRSQEAHYEGGSADQGAQTGANDEQELPQQAASHRGRLQQSAPLASNNEATAGSQDDEDYLDEGADTESLPQNRIGSLSRSASRASPEGAPSRSVTSDERRSDSRDQPYGPPSGSSGKKIDNSNQLDAETDPNDQTSADDYSPANEDMYFSRKPSTDRASSPNKGDEVPLNLAASNNRQQNEILANAKRAQNRPEESGDLQEGPGDINGLANQRSRTPADANEPEDEAEDDGGGDSRQSRSRLWQKGEPRR